MIKEIYFKTIDSTNAYLKRNYDRLDDFCFVSADEQSSGRGRQKRIWYSESGKNLLFSVLIKDKDLIDHFENLSIVSAYAILKVLEGYGIRDLGIKWPNDVYIGNRKVCGINVNQTVFPEAYLTEPVSMKGLLKKDISIQKLKKELFEELIACFERIRRKEDFYPRISSYDLLKGKTVTAEIDGRQEEVIVAGICPDYSLQVVCHNEKICLRSGEISFHSKEV